MKYNEFIAQVQRRAHLDTRDEAELAAGAVFVTLAERLAGGEALSTATICRSR